VVFVPDYIIVAIIIIAVIIVIQETYNAKYGSTFAAVALLIGFACNCIIIMVVLGIACILSIVSKGTGRKKATLVGRRKEKRFIL